jgi:hypothetical protein
MYTSLLMKSQEAQVAANVERRQIGEQFRVIDSARVPQRPYSPDRRLARQAPSPGCCSEWVCDRVPRLLFQNRAGHPDGTVATGAGDRPGNCHIDRAPHLETAASHRGLRQRLFPALWCDSGGRLEISRRLDVVELMYEAFFGLRERPFNLTPDPRFLFMTAGHREALTTIQYGISGRKGITLLVGEAGTGKTTLVHAALRSHEGRNVRAIHMANPTLTRSEFFQFLATELGLTEAAANSKTYFLRELDATLRQRHDAGLVTALIVDEAQAMSDAPGGSAIVGEQRASHESSSGAMLEWPPGSTRVRCSN